MNNYKEKINIKIYKYINVHMYNILDLRIQRIFYVINCKINIKININHNYYINYTVFLFFQFSYINFFILSII